MGRAKKLLETSMLSVKQVAARLGYDDSSCFAEDFRKMYGCIPLRHRRLALTGDAQVAIERRPRTMDCGQGTKGSKLGA